MGLYNLKPAIYVFCEGESEMAYTQFLRDKFSDVVAIQYPIKAHIEDVENKITSTKKYITI